MKQWLCIKGDLWFQTKVEEDISNRFKMLDISNRFKIWDFKYILNVDLWLHSCTASNPPSPLLRVTTIQNTLCKCSWSDAIVSKVISGFRQKWRKVTASCGGLLWKMEVDEKVHEDDLIWDLKVIKVETWRAPIMTTTSWFPLLRYGATGRSPCQLMTGQKQVQWISYKYLGAHIDLLLYVWSVPPNAWSHIKMINWDNWILIWP